MDVVHEVDSMVESERKLFESFEKKIEMSRDEASKVLRNYFNLIQNQCSCLWPKNRHDAWNYRKSPILLSYVKSRMAKLAAEKKMQFFNRMIRFLWTGYVQHKLIINTKLFRTFKKLTPAAYVVLCRVLSKQCALLKKSLDFLSFKKWIPVLHFNKFKKCGGKYFHILIARLRWSSPV